MALFQRKDKPPEQELERLKAARRKLETDDVEDRQRIPQLREALATTNIHAVLNGSKPRETFPDPAELANDATSIRGEIAACETRIQERTVTRPALIERIRDQMRVVAAAKAAAVRSDAAKVRTAYDAHLAERDRLQKALEDFAGIAYRQHPYPEIPVGNVVSDLELQLMKREPKSAEFKREILRLERQAAAIEQQSEQASKGGIAVADTLEDLLAQTSKADLGPVDEAVKRWHKQVTALADRQWAMAWSGAEHPTLRRIEYTLTWSDGVIDPQRSTAINRQARDIPAEDAARAAKIAALPVLTSQGLGVG